MAGTSAVIALVVPSIKLDGTKASAIQRHRVFHAIGSLTPVAFAPFSPSVSLLESASRLRHLHARYAHAAVNATNPAYATLHSRLWVCKRSSGSSSSGYASSPTRLPALLAAYRKYGSLASFIPESANHLCMIEVVAESAKNGRPTTTSKSSKTQPTGLLSAGGSHPAGICRGSKPTISNGNATITRWIAICILRPKNRRTA